MLSNKILHKMVQDMKRITSLDCAVWDMKGTCLVTTHKKLHKFEKEMEDLRKNPKAEEVLSGDHGFFLVMDDEEPVYILNVQGESTDIALAGRMGVSQLTSLLFAYKDKMDKNRFIQNLLLDNLLMVDLYTQADKMHIATDVRRVVYAVEKKQEGEALILETLRGLYGAGRKDFVMTVDEQHVILVKELDKNAGDEEVEQTARVIVDTLNMEAMASVRVAYGSIVQDLKEVSHSYKEAQMALEVGRVFYPERGILAYGELGIGRLIHQLPQSLCEMFLKEIFDGEAATLFEEEELTTVYTFFDNNLNISETARQLYIHRNTLVHRLEKIQKKTGLDVRVFDEAMTFKIAMMVAEHIKYIKA